MIGWALLKNNLKMLRLLDGLVWKRSRYHQDILFYLFVQGELLLLQLNVFIFVIFVIVLHFFKFLFIFQQKIYLQNINTALPNRTYSSEIFFSSLLRALPKLYTSPSLRRGNMYLWNMLVGKSWIVGFITNSLFPQKSHQHLYCSLRQKNILFVSMVYIQKSVT